MTQVPSGWTLLTLGDVRVDRSTRVAPGETPEEVFELFSIPSFPSGVAEVVRGSEIGSDKQSVETGTVLVSKINPRINRVWVVRPRTTHRVIASTEWVTFAPVDAVLPEYLAYYLRRDDFREYLSANVSGVGGSLMRVRPAVIDRYPLVLAPLAEQRRIVAALEEHLTDLDAAVAGLKRSKANIQRLISSVLIATAYGRLHAPASSDPRAMEPLAAGRATLPEGWRWVTVDDVGNVLLGRQRAPQYLTGRYSKPYLRVANVGDDVLDLSDLKEMDFDAVHAEKYALRPGDILVSEGQSPELVGQSAIYRGGVPGLCFQKTLHRFRADTGRVVPEYAQIVFRAFVRSGDFQRFASLTVNIAHLTLERFKAVPFPLPPLHEQRAIVAEVERRLAIAGHTAAEIAVQLARAARLRQAILKRGFEGRLVPRDSDNGPASTLIAHRAESTDAATPPARRTRGVHARPIGRRGHN